MLVHIARTRDRASIISIPRDSYVTVPAGGRWAGGKNKINAAFAFGGAPLAAKTVQQLTGVPLDGAMIANFGSVHELVDAVDGVQVCVPYQVNSIMSSKVWTEGCHDMTGAEADEFMRQRYDVPGGDFGRMHNQQLVIKATIAKATADGLLSNPLTFDDLLITAADALTVDQDLDLRELALAVRDIRPANISYATVPYTTAGLKTPAGSAVQLDTKKAAEMFAAIKNDTIDRWLTDHPQADPGRLTGPQWCRPPAATWMKTAATSFGGGERVHVPVDRFDRVFDDLRPAGRAEGDDAEQDRAFRVGGLLQRGGELRRGHRVLVGLVAAVGEDQDLIGYAGPVRVPGRRVRRQNRVVQPRAGLLRLQLVDRPAQRAPVTRAQRGHAEQRLVVLVAVQLAAELPQPHPGLVRQQAGHRAAALADQLDPGRLRTRGGRRHRAGHVHHDQQVGLAVADVPGGEDVVDVVRPERIERLGGQGRQRVVPGACAASGPRSRAERTNPAAAGEVSLLNSRSSAAARPGSDSAEAIGYQV